MTCKRKFFLFQYTLFTMIVKVLLKEHVSNYHQKTQIVLVTFWDLGKTIQGLIYHHDCISVEICSSILKQLLLF